MSCIILDGKKVAKEIKDNLKKYIQEIIKDHPSLRLPKLTIYTDGLDEASKVYLKNKKKACEEVGITCDIITVDTKDTRFGLDYSSDGVILQLPIKNKEQEKHFLNWISSFMDVDGLSINNQGKLFQSINELEDPYQISCTPKGIMRLPTNLLLLMMRTFLPSRSIL